MIWFTGVSRGWRRLRRMMPGTRGRWRLIYDETKKKDYLVYWASTTGRDNYTKQAASGGRGLLISRRFRRRLFLLRNRRR